MELSVKKLASLATLFITAFAIALYIFRNKPGTEQAEANVSSYKANTIAADPLKNCYFGDLHLHTGFSFDAFSRGTNITPDQAYHFAEGDSVKFLNGYIKRRVPLDFLAVSDHSEYLAEYNTTADKESEVSKSMFGKIFNSGDTAKINAVYRGFVDAQDKGVKWEDLHRDNLVRSAWKTIIATANKNYRPGKFTTLIAYEWTATPNSRNLHRIVVFNGDKAPPVPFSSVESVKPEDLWTYLENTRKQGIDVLAIPHNANVSDGLMYDWKDSYGNPIDKKYAIRRLLNEPLTEISQMKGQSETLPSLSPDDEFSNFEVFQTLLTYPRKGKSDGSYIRQAYGRGLVLQNSIGANPYKFGSVGGSDQHNGLTNSDESTFDGNTKAVKTNIRAAVAKGSRSLLNASPSLTGVWAEENTREAIFSALKRKEVFATTGSMIKLRFFGGWNYSNKLVNDNNWVRSAYNGGVPMGGDLLKKFATGKVPTFAVWAIKDPASANLDRAQIIKVWVKDGKPYEKVFDVACSNGRKPDPGTGKVPAVGNTVDLKTATYTNTIGNTELKTVWHDPEFDPKVAAVYYLRVLEIPTPRWSTILAVKAGLPIPEGVAPIIQERGWSSPIWYTP